MRHVWMDLARGLAVVSMFVAHTSPAGGILAVSEYVTAPLFAALLGGAAHHVFERWRGGTGRYLLAMSLRGLILLGAGMLAQPIYAQIVVVLQWLGALSIPMALILVLRLRSSWLLIGAAAVVAVSPPLMDAAREWRAADPFHAAAPLVDFLISGRYYRLFPMLASGLVGIVLARRLATVERVRLWPAVVACGAAAAAVVLGKITPLGGGADSGSWRELIASLALVVAAAYGSRWLAGLKHAAWFTPLVATGQLAMTAYVLQLVVLRVITDVVYAGGRDDHWWVLGVLTAGVVAFCTAWRRWVGRGPLERVLRLPLTALRADR